MDAAQTLAEVDRLRGRARARAHGGVWLPAALIALLLLLSIALYRDPFHEPREIVGAHPSWAGLPDNQRSATASYLFWFLATPLTVAAIAAWYRWRERRSGMRVAWPLVAATGLGVLVLLAVLAAIPHTPPPDTMTGDMPTFIWSGLLSPLVPVALAVIVLGRAERSWYLAVAGGWIAVLVVWLCGVPRLGAVPGGELALRPGHYVILMALPMAAFATVRALRR